MTGDGLDEAINGIGIGDVESFGQHFGLVLPADFFGGGIESVGIASAHGNARAFCGEGLGCGTSNSLTGRGNDSYTIAEAGFHKRRIIAMGGGQAPEEFLRVQSSLGCTGDFASALGRLQSASTCSAREARII